jgi:hypothetical protein
MQQQRSADFREITKMSRLRGVLLLCLLITLVLSSVSFAQKSTGTIRGTVTDPSDAVLSGATVTVTNPSTGLTRTVTTNASGEYVIADLPPGNYNLSFAAAGFKEFTSQNVVLNVASTYLQNAKLVVGSASDQVNVEANAIQVDTTSGEVSEVITGQQVRELPLNGRSFVQLTQLQPGVSPANNFDSKNKGLLSGVDFSVNGNATTNNLYLIDGANNNDVGSNRTILIYPSIEAIAEFKMLRNSYGAEYGQASGAVINIITRGGTNNFHGSVLYFGRNDALNATEYFAKQAGIGKDKLRRNDWGYSFGGPAIKDKLFFFWSQEWNRELRGAARTYCVPTDAERAGDFSAYIGQDTAGCGEAIPKLPGTGTPMYNISTAMGGLDPAGQLMVELLPHANLSTPTPSGANWAESLATPIRWRQENARVDFNLNKSNTLMGRYTQDTWTNGFPSGGSALGLWGDDPFPAVESSWAQPSKQIVGKLTSTISSSWVNDVEFAYSNNRINITTAGSNPELLDQLTQAIPTFYSKDLKTSQVGMPTLWGGFGAYGGGQNIWEIAPWHNNHDIYTVRDDMSKVVGSHTIKAGAFLGWVGKNEVNGATSADEYPAFGAPDWGVYNQSGPDCATQPYGCTNFQTNNALANILTPGTIFNMGENSTNTFVELRWRDYEFYAADTWKVRPNLTLDLGLRYSMLDTPFHPNGQFTSFQPFLYDDSRPESDACNGLWIVPGQDPCNEANQRFGTTFSSGVEGPNENLVEHNRHMFAPRVGINWDPFSDGNTSIRAGFGQFWQRERASPSYVVAANAPFRVNSGTVWRPLGSAPAPSGGSASPSGGRDPSNTMPYSLQWNFAVERGITRDTTIEIGYVGNHAVHQTTSEDINQVPRELWGQSAFMGDFRALRPYNNFGGLLYWSHRGDATYHGFQTLFRTKIKRSELNLAYTWSHSISNVVLDDSSGGFGVATMTDRADASLDRGNSAINRPHIFTANAVFFLPSFSGQNAFVKNAIGGWEYTVISTLATGNSLTALQNGGISETANTIAINPATGNPFATSLGAMYNSGRTDQMRPDVTGIACDSDRHGSQILNPDAFTLIGHVIGEPGNAPRGYCHGPALVNADMAIYKNWDMPFFGNERMKIQFRLEAFNVFNTANFRGDRLRNGTPFFTSVNCGAPDAGGLYMPCSQTNNVISRETKAGDWGVAQTPTRGAREIQYGLKLVF